MIYPFITSATITLNYYINKNQKIYSFLFSVIIFLIAQINLNVENFFYDSALYWALADPTNFRADTITTRGYVFPLFIYLIRQISDASLCSFFLYGFIVSIIYAAVLTIILPHCFSLIYGGTLSFFRRLIPVILVAFFFPGLIFYPLSDLPALLLLWSGIFFIYKIYHSQTKNRINIIFFGVMSGILVMASYNTRPIYIFSIPIIIALSIAFSKGFRIIALVSIIAGMLIIGLPQAFFNQKVNNEFTPLVTFPMGKNSLFVSQLLAGVSVQRYETSRITGSLAYLDPTGLKLIQKVRGKFSISTFPEYVNGSSKNDAPVTLNEFLGLITDYPFEFFSIYVRHAVNGLDARDGEIYVENSTSGRNMTSLLNALVLFIGLLACTFPNRSNHNNIQNITYNEYKSLFHKGSKIITTLALIIPALAIIPGAVETRFFLPIHLLIYFFISFKYSFNHFKHQIKNDKHILIILVFLFYLYISISINSFSYN